MMSTNTDLKSFSFSAISTFKNCPRSFKYRYIEKLPEAFNTIEAHMGSSVHEALEWAYIKRQEGYEPTLQEALEQYSHSFNSGDFENIKIVKTDKVKQDYYNDGRRFLISFFERVFPYDKSTTLYLEHQFSIKMGDDIVYRGIIDRIAKSEDGTMLIIDYKTGKVGDPLDTNQLPSYALYIFQHNIDAEVRLCYEDLRENRSMCATFSRKDARKVKEALLADIQDIRNTREEDFRANPSILCRWCGYNTICESAQLDGTPLKASSGVDGEYLEVCPSCGGQLRERKGKFGAFMGCVNFPECRYTRDLGVDRKIPANNPDTEGKDICPECGSLLKKRKGKFGDFYGCSSYPQCRFTRPVE